MASPRRLRGWVPLALGTLLVVSLAAPVAAAAPSVTLHVSSAPATGHDVTLTPVVSGYTIQPNDVCRWEFRWGTTTALDQTYTGASFGGMAFTAGADIGGCGPWTLTLPWVPYPQFDAIVDVQATDGGFDMSDSVRFMAAVDSTDRHILTSNLPIAQVLPSSYNPIAGLPVTYTLFLIGDVDTCCNPHWLARLGDERTGPKWEQSGGSTFTFTPTMAGNLIVEWHAETADRFIDVYYDPPVKPKDTARPTTAAPAQRIGGGAAGDTVPISASWSGSDTGGSGVKAYQIQRSVNGGTWTYVHIATPTSTSVGTTAAAGSKLRFRVRAIDKAGNYGYWTYGPTFAVQRLSDTRTAARYSTGAWSVPLNADALGGSLHETSKAGAAVSVTVTARDLAWIAEKGPGHGQAKVYLDGTSVTTVDLNAASTTPRVVVFSRHFSGVGTHVLRIVNVATASRPLIDVDGIAYLR